MIDNSKLYREAVPVCARSSVLGRWWMQLAVHSLQNGRSPRLAHLRSVANRWCRLTNLINKPSHSGASARPAYLEAIESVCYAPNATIIAQTVAKIPSFILGGAIGLLC